MSELQEIYLALKKRAEELKRKTTNVEEELRFDIEACIDLISQELKIDLYKNS